MYMWGDITEYLQYPTLVRNRICDDANGIIVNVNTKRYWDLLRDVEKYDIPYVDKINKIIWRGVTTGDPNTKPNRFDLVTKYFNYDTTMIDVGFNCIVQNKDSYSKYTKCSISIRYQLRCKYILSIEGNDVASGLNWQLSSNSVVIMPKPRFVSWLMEDLLLPYVHYVPVKKDFSDLEHIYDWCNNNEQKCKDIIDNAKNFMRQFNDPMTEGYIHTEILKRYLSNVSVKARCYDMYSLKN